MRRERNTIARNVAEQLWEAERHNDMAMASTARLIAAALEARLQLKAGACVGQAAVDALTETMDRQASSRRLLLQAHEVLDEVKESLGIVGEDFGGGGDKQVPKISEILELPVRRVA